VPKRQEKARNIDFFVDAEREVGEKRAVPLPRDLVVSAPGRADQILAAQIPTLSRRQARELCSAGGIKCDTKSVRAGDRLASGDALTIDWQRLDSRTPEERARLAAKANDIVALAHGETWLALRKPAGLPSVGGFLSDELHFAAMVAASTTLPDGGLVHRLDNDTSGVCLFARDAETHAAFLQQRHAHTLWRRYLALVGDGIADDGEVTLPLGHHPSDEARMRAVTDGAAFRGEPQSARTVYHVLRRGGGAALVSVEIWGGRRHQIRAHLAHLGWPVLGDPIYGTAAARLGLHAARLQFVDPITHSQVVVEADPGAHFWNLAPALRPEEE
jgi:23S rRNA pseudouridine1911/1915/1917 synthase